MATQQAADDEELNKESLAAGGGDPDDSSASTRGSTGEAGLSSRSAGSSSASAATSALSGSSQSLKQQLKARGDDTRLEACYAFTGRVLGTGAGGGVREAECRSSGALLAVKTLALDGDEDDGQQLARQRARREADIHGALQHPHIVRVERRFESEQAVHIVMERLEGGELLRRIVQVQGFSEPAAARVTVQLLRALAYLHARGIVHRDLKPENVVYKAREGDLVKLVDFGFAIRRQPGQRLKARCGTVRYTAPEVLDGDGYDERADLYSLGAVVHAMLLGRPPCEAEGGTTEAPRRRAARRGSSSPAAVARSGLSEAARDFLSALLASKPANRPSIAAALSSPWLEREAPEEARAALREVEADPATHPAALQKGPPPSVFAGASCLAGVVATLRPWWVELQAAVAVAPPGA